MKSTYKRKGLISDLFIVSIGITSLIFTLLLIFSQSFRNLLDSHFVFFLFSSLIWVILSTLISIYLYTEAIAAYNREKKEGDEAERLLKDK